MPDYIAEFCYRCCTQDMHEMLTHHTSTLKWIGKFRLDDNDAVTRRTLGVIRLYDHKYKKSPPSIDALIAWIRLNPDNVEEFEKTTAFTEELETLKAHRDLEEDTIKPAEWELDDKALLAALVAQTRERWIGNVCRFAMGVNLGAVKVNVSGDRYGKEETGPSAAIKYLRSQCKNDITTEVPAEAGFLHENAPSILAELQDRLSANNAEGRFPIGLPHIDNLVTVGKQALRFIGIVGMSGDGKTTLTNYVTYQWLRAGANVLYVSTEHTPREIWEFMAFLHGSHPDYPFTLPSMQDWDKGNISRDDPAYLSHVLDDIHRRRNLTGLLDVQQFTTWEEITSHLEANHEKNRYDCLVIDYIGRLHVPGDQRFRDKAVGALVHDAQRLTRSFDSNKGLIVLTPIQVNREGNKKAHAADDGSDRYDLNAISGVSEYQHDLDLCLSVYSNADMKMGDQVEIQTIKKRKGGQPPPAKMYIDRASGAFTYAPENGTPHALKQMWEKTVDDVIAGTTGITSEDWGL